MFSEAIKKIAVSRILSMKEIKEWLEENRHTYQLACDEMEKSKNDVETFPNGVQIKRIAFLDEEPDWFKLCFLYKEIEEIADYHQYEPYFKEELERYQSIKESKELQQEWVRKNLDLGCRKFNIFEAIYLDYEGNEVYDEDKCPLQISVMCTPPISVLIDRNDFKYTLEFIHLFYELFYVKNLLPNCIERIQADFLDFKKFRLN